MLDRITAVRYVTPLREGGSLPGIVEADDDGTYVVKFHGAGQGPKVLVAEVLVSELARTLGIRTPRLAVVELPAAIARYEADEEVQDLLTASPGVNLAVDFLPGALGYDGSQPPPADEAARLLWLDAFTANVDRTWANPNLLLWHRQVWAIDHGAALYFHFSWPSRGPDAGRFARQGFDLGRHVLADLARPAPEIHGYAEDRLDRATLEGVVAVVPEEWLETTAELPTTGAVRTAYVDHLVARLASPEHWWGTP